MLQLIQADDQLIRMAGTKALRAGDASEQFRRSSIQLLTAIVKFFDSSLRFFGRSNLSNCLLAEISADAQGALRDELTGNKEYETAKSALQAAIHSYEKASTVETHNHIYETARALSERNCRSSFTVC
jgi:hypothetical protein